MYFIIDMILEEESMEVDNGNIPSFIINEFDLRIIYNEFFIFDGDPGVLFIQENAWLHA